jgi:hypothetical protein
MQLQNGPQIETLGPALGDLHLVGNLQYGKKLIVANIIAENSYKF